MMRIKVTLMYCQHLEYQGWFTFDVNDNTYDNFTYWHLSVETNHVTSHTEHSHLVTIITLIVFVKLKSGLQLFTFAEFLCIYIIRIIVSTLLIAAQCSVCNTMYITGESHSKNMANVRSYYGCNFFIWYKQYINTHKNMKALERNTITIQHR